MSRLDKVENADVICNLFEKKKFRCEECQWHKGHECYLPDQMNLSSYQLRNLAHGLGEFLDV